MELIDVELDQMGLKDNEDSNEGNNEDYGRVFMFNSPLVVNSPDLMNNNQTCLCGKVATMICSRCIGVWYCSQQCQIKGWAGHKEQCKGKVEGDNK